MNDKDTQELWELCGFVLRGGAYTGRKLWAAPDEIDAFDRACAHTDNNGYARMPHEDTYYSLPELTLDNYWKYVIPTLQKEYRNWRSLLHDWVDSLAGSHEGDVPLLFAQTYDIMKEKRKE